jgi:hypothetical protein
LSRRYRRYKRSFGGRAPAPRYPGRASKARILEALREGASDEAAKQIDGTKKQAMAKTAKQLPAGKDSRLFCGHTPSQPAEQNESAASYPVAAE